MAADDGLTRTAACDHDWRDIDGRWLCIECKAEKPYASDAAKLWDFIKFAWPIFRCKCCGQWCLKP